MAGSSPGTRLRALGTRQQPNRHRVGGADGIYEENGCMRMLPGSHVGGSHPIAIQIRTISDPGPESTPRSTRPAPSGRLCSRAKPQCIMLTCGMPLNQRDGQAACRCRPRYITPRAPGTG